ncbi:MAG: phage tail protein, partial [Clostridium sp.]
VFLPKVFFNVPEQAATTKGESIEWQTPTITGTVMRSDLVDDKYEHPWMMDAWFQTRAEAALYLEYKCGKTDA